MEAEVPQVPHATEDQVQAQLSQMAAAFAKGQTMQEGEQGGQQYEAKPGQEVFVKQLHEAKAKGNVESRMPVFQRFSKWLAKHPDQAALYRDQGSNSAKKAFRMKWTDNQIAEHAVLRRSKLELLQEEVGEKGVYMHYDKVIVEEGGKDCPGAITRATNYCAYCISVGWPMIEFNPMKGCMEVLYFSKVRSSFFKREWGLLREETTVIPGPDAQAARPESSPTSSNEPKVQGSPARLQRKNAVLPLPEPESAGSKRPATNDEDPPRRPKAKATAGNKKAKTAADEGLKQACASRTRYARIKQQHQTIIWNISHNDSYSWANNDQVKGHHERLMAAIDQAFDVSPFVRQFMNSMGASLQQSYSPDDFNKLLELTNCGAITGALDAADDEQKRFNRMHKASVGTTKAGKGGVLASPRSLEPERMRHNKQHKRHTYTQLQ